MSNALTTAATAADGWTICSNRLKDIRDLGQCGYLNLNGRRLLIHGGEQRFLDETGSLVKQLQSTTDWIDLTGEFQRLMPDSKEMQHTVRNGRPLDELMWACAWKQFDGELLDGCRRDDVVSFNRWPNLSRLPHQGSTHRIVALLTQRPSSIVLASRLLRVPEADIAQVYCAAQRAGYAAPINRTVEEPVTKTHRHQSLISRLMARLQR
ncbi:MAG: hypothetical protein CMI09_14200 [Oceanospirillaceae bacterium]|nr:hypothetical protein [Oceanospirillaceae bacterium]